MLALKIITGINDICITACVLISWSKEKNNHLTGLYVYLVSVFALNIFVVGLI